MKSAGKRKNQYLCAVQHRDVLDILDLVEKILRTSDVNTVALCRRGVIECEGYGVHLLGRELKGWSQSQR